jgi:hypothetical protein
MEHASMELALRVPPPEAPSPPEGYKLTDDFLIELESIKRDGTSNWCNSIKIRGHIWMPGDMAIGTWGNGLVREIVYSPDLQEAFFNVSLLGPIQPADIGDTPLVYIPEILPEPMFVRVKENLKGRAQLDACGGCVYRCLFH